MRKIKKYKFVILVACFIFLNLVYFNSKQDKEVVKAKEQEEIKVDNELEIKKMKVEIKGCVKNPGVYEVKDGDRVIDVIKLSGGLNNDSDTSLINLSKNLTDEMVVYIYTKEETKNLKKKDVIEYIKVDIKGEILKPGVYEISKGSRIIDLITISGGLTDNSDTTKINLSKILTDEMMVYINSKEIIKEDSNVKIIDESDNSELKKISINNDSLELLMTLPGIGEAKALKIIEYRKENPFKAISDITNVSGISETIYEKIKDSITL